MQFNFYQNYQAAHKEELIHIVRHPQEYMPEAVAAAMQVLQERYVPQEEILNTALPQAKGQAWKIKLSSKLETIHTNSENVLESMLQPQEEFAAKKWVQFIIIGLSILLLYNAYVNFRYFRYLISRFQQCAAENLSNRHGSIWYCAADLLEPYNLITLSMFIYLPVIIYWLYKRKRFGWICLFAECVYSLTVIVKHTFLSFYHPDYYFVNWIMTLLVVSIKGSIIYFLWREDVADYLNVSKDVKMKTLVGTACFSLMVVFVLGIMF